MHVSNYIYTSIYCNYAQNVLEATSIILNTYIYMYITLQEFMITRE